MELQGANYVLNNNIIPPKYTGFKSGYNCSTPLSDVVDDQAQDSGKSPRLLQGHLAILVAILKYIGFQHAATSLISSFLSNKKQLVCLDREVSETCKVKSGVPNVVLLDYSYIVFTL